MHGAGGGARGDAFLRNPRWRPGVGTTSERRERARVSVSAAPGRRFDPEKPFRYTVKPCRRDSSEDVRKWRNWQTRKPQELVAARPWRFESSLPHQHSAP